MNKLIAERILIPIDFRVESLNTLKRAMLEIPTGKPVVAVLVYSEFLSDSISELLFTNPRKRIRELTREEFRRAMAILRNRFEGQLLDIGIELFQLHSVNGARNFLSAKKISHIYCPKDYTLHLGSKGFNPVPLLKKTGFPLTEVSWDRKNHLNTEDQLANLFN